MSSRFAGAFGPFFITQPAGDGEVGRSFLFQAFPEDATVASFGNVGENCILLNSVHSVRIGGIVSARSYSEETVLRIDGPESSFVIEMHPGDVISHAFDFVSYWMS